MTASPARRTAKLAFRRGRCRCGACWLLSRVRPADGRDARTASRPAGSLEKRSASDTWGISSVQTQMNKLTGQATTLTVVHRTQNLCVLGFSTSARVFTTAQVVLKKNKPLLWWKMEDRLVGAQKKKSYGRSRSTRPSFCLFGTATC